MDLVLEEAWAPNLPSPDEEMETSLFRCTSFFLRLSRNSLALGSWALCLDCDLERESPRADWERELPPDGASCRRGEPSSPSEDSSLESSSPADSFLAFAFCGQVSLRLKDPPSCSPVTCLGRSVVACRSATFWWCIIIAARFVRVDVAVAHIHDIETRVRRFAGLGSV